MCRNIVKDGISDTQLPPCAITGWPRLYKNWTLSEIEHFSGLPTFDRQLAEELEFTPEVLTPEQWRFAAENRLTGQEFVDWIRCVYRVALANSPAIKTQLARLSADAGNGVGGSDDAT